MPPALALLAILFAPQTPDATRPPATRPPATAHLRLTAIGRGVQVYRCAGTQTNNQPPTFAWTLEGPEADLFDTATSQPVATHTAGPTWTWHDGSSITGKVLQKQPSPDPLAIPWLLLEAHAANDTAGALTGITLVRRSDTEAGAAPATGCDAQHLDNVLRVPYKATYTFYSTN